MDDKLYNLNGQELKLIEGILPQLEQREVTQMKEVIDSILDSIEVKGRIEMIGKYGQAEKAAPAAIDEKKSKAITDLDKIINLTKEQARARYSIGTNNLRDIADRIGALNFNGNRMLFVRQILDDYFNKGEQVYRPRR